MTPGVTRGILECLDAGVLSATSVMTTSRWWPDYAEPLLGHAARVDIGLHLNLTSDAPLGAMPILAPAGKLPTVGTLMRLARTGALPLAEIADEIERQAERFETVLGRPPDHVDGHQHVHVLAPIRPLVLAVCRRRGWNTWMRDSSDLAIRILRRRETVTKALGLAVLSRRFQRDAENNGFAVNKGFSGFSSFDASGDYAQAFSRYLVAPGPRHLIMCHPGQVDDELRRLDPVVATREQELAFLLSPRFAAIKAERGATLSRLSRRIVE